MLCEKMKQKGINVDWAEEFNGAITVCNRQGIIVYMNRFSVQQFAKYGGAKLLGSNLLDCHPEPYKTKLMEMLQAPSENMYTVEKDDVTRIVYQTPWMQEGVFSGLVELSFQLPAGMAHFIQTKTTNRVC